MGRYYSDIGDGTDIDHLDYCVVSPNRHDDSVVIIKKRCSLVAFSANAVKAHNFNNPLNAKICESPDEAYVKMMKWMGKMLKKDKSGRYFNNKADHEYMIPENITEKDLFTISGKLRRAREIML